MYQRGTAADRLADIIQVIRLARRTGQLIAERGVDFTTLEEGTIMFVDGQVMEARAGYRNGLDAFNWLNSWQSCRFTFVPSAPPATLPGISTPQRQTPYRSTTAPLPPTNGHLPPQTTDSIPRRLRHPNEALPYFERLGLTRTHRHLFLLIDGQRTTTELLRLMQHRSGADEVYTLLTDLERAGLIQY